MLALLLTFFVVVAVPKNHTVHFLNMENTALNSMISDYSCKTILDYI